MSSLVDLSHKNHRGETPMHVALQGDYQEAAGLLLRQLPDPGLQNQAGLCVLELIAQKLAEYSSLTPVPEGTRSWLFNNTSAGAAKRFRALARLAAERNRLKENLFAFQTIVETYAVDWGGEYAPGLPELYQEANLTKRRYWQELINPFNQRSGLEHTLVGPGPDHPAAGDAGKVYNQPLSDADGRITTYRIYGIDHRGGFYRHEHAVYSLANS